MPNKKGDSKAMQALHKMGSPIDRLNTMMADTSAPKEMIAEDTSVTEEDILTPGETLDAFIMSFLDQLEALSKTIEGMDKRLSDLEKNS